MPDPTSASAIADDASLTFTWLHDPAAFHALKLEWDALTAEAQVQTVFLTHDWLECWWETYGAGSELWVLVAWDESGSLAGAVPLMLQSGRGLIRRLSFIGTGEITPNHLDVIARPDQHDNVLRRLAEKLDEASSRWDMVELNKLPGDSDTPTRLAVHMQKMGMQPLVETCAWCPYVDLAPSFAEYLRTLGSSSRNDLRKKGNRLRRDFKEVCVTRAETPDELERAMAALIEMHQARWTRRGYTGAFSTARFVEFHRRAALRALQSGQLRLYYLEVDSSLAAVQYAYRVGDRVQGYLIGFDDRWSDYSPGVIVLAGAIECSIEEGAREFDLLEGDESYKQRWATGVRANICLRAYNPSPRGQAARVRVQGTETLMEWSVRYVPVGLRRPIWQAIQRLKAALRGG